MQEIGIMLETGKSIIKNQKTANEISLAFLRIIKANASKKIIKAMEKIASGLKIVYKVRAGLFSGNVAWIFIGKMSQNI